MCYITSKHELTFVKEGVLEDVLRSCTALLLSPMIEIPKVLFA